MKKLTEKEEKELCKMLGECMVRLEPVKFDTSERCYVIKISHYDAIIQRVERIAKEEAAKAFLAMINPGCEECDAKQHEGCVCNSERIKIKLKRYMEGI